MGKFAVTPGALRGSKGPLAKPGVYLRVEACRITTASVSPDVRPSFTLLSFAALAAATILNSQMASGARRSADADSDSGATPATHHRRHGSPAPDAEATPKPKSSPAPRHHPSDTDAGGSDQTTATPSPAGKKKSSTKHGAATPAPSLPDDEPPLPNKGKASSKSDTPTPDANEKPEKPGSTSSGHSYYPDATVSTSDLVGFDEQPEKVRTIIRAALDLTKLNLTYLYGSAEPSNGGMDCSGTIYYLLRQQGFTEVPRDASGQYVWARKNGQFFAVISRKAGGFEFSDLQPGDLLFWSGTYAVDRDPPVTHTMIYLGQQKSRKVPIMWGSSDGRSYDGKQRWGVSVFDFTMPKGDPENPAAPRAVFLGYARIPGLRT